MNLTGIRDLAIECVKEMVEAGGTCPWDEDGECLLATEPLLGDLDALEDMLGRKPTAEEEHFFCFAYRSQAAKAISSAKHVRGTEED